MPFPLAVQVAVGPRGAGMHRHRAGVDERTLIESSFGDRTLIVTFTAGSDGVTVRETFDAETTYPVEQQRQGWQAILNNFKKHVEAK